MLAVEVEQHIQALLVQAVQAAVVTVKHLGVHRLLVQVL